MRKKLVYAFFTAALCGSLFACSGCGVDLTSINEGETTLSAEMEAENLSDGTLTVHCVWYDTDGERLSNASVVFSVDEEVVFSATTDENGKLEEGVIPGNTTITCDVTDASGEILASSLIVCKISSEYSDLTIYTVSAEDDSERILEIPSDQTDLRVAIYLTEEGQISFVNLTPYSESYDAEDTSSETELEGTIIDEDDEAFADDAEADDAEADDAEADEAAAE